MIKINLLPVKKKRKPKVEIPKIPILPMVLVTAVTLIAVGFVWFTVESKISKLKTEKASKEKTLADLKTKIKDVENFEKDNKKLEEKKNIIEQLKKNQSGPLRLLDELSSCLPERVWLSTLNESGGTVSVEGFAFSNSDIVIFVNNLKGSKYLSDVGLIESKQTAQEKVPVYNFKITCKVKV